MKKTNPILALIAFLTLSKLPFASAQGYRFGNTRDFVTNGINTLLDLLSPLFEGLIGDYSSSEFFFSKVLLLILSIVIIAKILEKTPIGNKNKKLSLLISILISVISIRFINENELFEAIFIQYGTIGIAITTILPMVIFFYFVHNTKIGSYGRKVFWAIYAITLGAIWISKSSEIPEVANWIYGITFLAALIFIFLDRSIHSYFGLSDFRKFERDTNKKSIRKWKRKLRQLAQDRDHGIITQEEFEKERKEIRKEIKDSSSED